MNTKLPLYNPKVKCPKCGSIDIAVEYCMRQMDRCPHYFQTTSEHLDRVCRNCHYKWLERCLDDDSQRS